MKKLTLIIALLISIITASAQTVTLIGTVVDEEGKPLSDVSVYVQERGKTEVFTDSTGQFQIVLIDTAKHKTLVFRLNGYPQQTYSINLPENDIRFVMKKSIPPTVKADSSEDKVVTIGDYGVARPAVPYRASEFRKTEGEVVPEEIAVDYREIEAVEMLAFPDKRVPKSPSSQNSIQSGTLTAGEVNDFAKWHLWDDVLKTTFGEYTKQWGFQPTQRYMAQLTNTQGMPISNAHVRLMSGNEEIWQAKTDNTGKAELWNNFFKSETKTTDTELKLIFDYKGISITINNAVPFKNGINTAQIKTECDTERNAVDVFFMIDATGSMSDELHYLQVELDDIIKKINSQQSNLDIRTGALVYRDLTDGYITRKSQLTGKINKTLDFLHKQSAGGGGDYPEAVDYALEESVLGENWNSDALARILFIVLDAPSHTNPENIARLEAQLRIAAEKGIRIVPIACSDIQKNGEYLMRSFALATNGTYVFLTDDSGVGNAHIKPSTDKYDVEKLNDAIVRIIKQYTTMPDCKENQQWAEKSKEIEESDVFVPNPYDENRQEGSKELTVADVIKVYPNPCSTILKIEIKEKDVKDIYFVDMTGKTLFSINAPEKGTVECDVQRYSTGIYFVKAYHKGKWFNEKVVKKAP